MCGPEAVRAFRPSCYLLSCLSVASGLAARALPEKRRASGAQEPGAARVRRSRPDHAGAVDARGPGGSGSVCRGGVCPSEVCGSEGPRGRGRAPSERDADPDAAGQERRTLLSALEPWRAAGGREMLGDGGAAGR